MSDEEQKSPWSEWLGMSSGPASMVYGEWEAWFGKQLERLAGSDQFAGQISAAFERSAGLRAILETAVRSVVKRGGGGPDVSALEQRIEALEREVRALKAARNAPATDG